MVSDYITDNEASIGKPNRYLLQTIKEASKTSEMIVVYAGGAHVNSNHTKSDTLNNINCPERKKLIFDLYEGLDRFADENPYAVLSCKL